MCSKFCLVIGLAVSSLLVSVVHAQCDVQRISAQPGGGIGPLDQLNASTAVFAGGNWVRAVDFSDPSAIRFGDAIEVSAQGHLAVANGAVYAVASDTKKISVLTFNSEVGFEKVSEVLVDVNRITASGDLLLAPGDASSPTIIDITDPVDPIVLAEGVSGINYSSVPRSGDLIWCVNGVARNFVIRAWNIANPSDPTLVSEFSVGDEFVSDLMLVDGVLYVLARDRVIAVDYASPTSPAEIASIELPGWSYSLARDGNYLYFPMGLDGLFAVDISNAATPFPAGEVVVEEVEGDRVSRIDFINDHALLTLGAGRLVSMNVIHPLRMVTRSEIRQPAGSTYARHVADGLAIVAESGRLMYLLSLVDPDQPQIVWSEYFHSDIVDVVSDGHSMFVATAWHGIYLYDVGDLSNPIKLSAIKSTGSVQSLLQWIDARDGVMISMPGSNFLWIHDVSDPSNPVLVSELSDSRLISTRYIQMLNGLAYIGGPSRNLRILDYTNPASPWFTDYFSQFFALGEQFVIGSRMYGSGELAHGIFDISDPARRVRIGTVPSAGPSAFQYPFGLEGSVLVSLANDLQAEPRYGWVLHDVRDPANPREMAVVPREFEFGSSLLRGSWLYNLSRDGVLVAYEMTDCTVCIADYDDNGLLDFFDLAAFLNDYTAQSWRADITQDGNWTIDDVIMFIDIFLKGCN